MKTLIIIPTTKTNYETGLSAPAGWLFSSQKVYGIYGFELNKEYAISYDTFIIELNWYVELYEFIVITDFIKKHNRDARILFGGLYASLMYKTIFERYNVDYYIKGDNEYPVQMFLDDKDPEKIPNFVGRDFENEISYIFKEEDFKTLEFNLNWFPSYFKYLKDSPFPGRDTDFYVLPMIITTKGGCTAAHKGCEYCMGSRHDMLEKIYERKPVVMDNESLIVLLKKIDKKYEEYSIYITSEYTYDFSGEFFESVSYIEIDSPVNFDQLKNMFKAFRKCHVMIPLYEEGIMGEKIIDFKELLTLEDENHRIKFPAYRSHINTIKDIPWSNILFNLDLIFSPDWAHWNVYTNFDLAFKNSQTIYNYYRKNGFPVFYEL
jgi:hypothetical protein